MQVVWDNSEPRSKGASADKAQASPEHLSQGHNFELSERWQDDELHQVVVEKGQEDQTTNSAEGRQGAQACDHPGPADKVELGMKLQNEDLHQVLGEEMNPGKSADREHEVEELGQEDVATCRMEQGVSDEEFEYAFQGGPRAAPSAAPQVYQATAPPQHLLTDMKMAELGSVAEEEEGGQAVAAMQQADCAQGPVLPRIRAQLQETGGSSPSLSGSRRGSGTPQGLLGYSGNEEDWHILKGFQLHAGALDRPGSGDVDSQADSTFSIDVQGSEDFSESSRPAESKDSTAQIVQQPADLPLDEHAQLALQWEAANQAQEAQAGAAVSALRPKATEQWVTYTEARSYFDKFAPSSPTPGDLGSKAGARNSPWSTLLGCCTTPQVQGEVVIEERARILAFAKMPFSESEPLHLQILQAVYANLAGTTTPVARFGSHWENIGFQGTDPATDLRAAGVFGLLQLLFFVHHNPRNAACIYHYSRDTVLGFPLAVVAINITKWALDALRDGRLAKPISKKGCVLDVVNEFFIGSFYELFIRWRGGEKTMKDSGFVLQEVDNWCKKRPQAAMARSDTHLIDPEGAEHEWTNLSL